MKEEMFTALEKSWRVSIRGCASTIVIAVPRTIRKPALT
jgi:hypothetical protein